MKTSKDCKIKHSLLTFIGTFYLENWSFVIWRWLFVSKIYLAYTVASKYGGGKIPRVTLMVYKTHTEYQKHTLDSQSKKTIKVSLFDARKKTVSAFLTAIPRSLILKQMDKCTFENETNPQEQHGN